VTVDLAKFYKAARPKSLTREYVYDRRDSGSFQIEDSVAYADSGKFDTALTTDLEFALEGRSKVMLGPTGRAGTVQIEASFDYDLKVEEIEKNGLRFTRIGIASTQKIANGWIRYKYLPPPNRGCP
jgi:hypothetical protein